MPSFEPKKGEVVLTWIASVLKQAAGNTQAITRRANRLNNESEKSNSNDVKKSVEEKTRPKNDRVARTKRKDGHESGTVGGTRKEGPAEEGTCLVKEKPPKKDGRDYRKYNPRIPRHRRDLIRE